MEAMTVLPVDREDAGLGVVRVKVSRNGQISVPAAVRHRWQASEVLIQDQGDRLIVRPVLPLDEIIGKYADRDGPTTDEMRAEERAADAEREDRREGRRP
jgi:bifunctional DNA-binding transcriptional regulator/antitoxin component of YhaV-PrlF toxin-antitoxin module